MKKFLAILTMLILAGSVSAGYCLEARVNVDTDTTKHFDPSHPGHMHQCPNCKREYHQVGDMGPNSAGYTSCPYCNPAPNPPVPPNPHPHPGPGPNPYVPPTPVPPYVNPYNGDPTYDQGYRDAYNVGYREGYPAGYQRGLAQGEAEGYRTGESNGYSRYLARYQDYTYTEMKLADLIGKLNFPGRTIVEQPVSRASLSKAGPGGPGGPGAPGTQNYYSQGYRDGMTSGRNAGHSDGVRDGARKTYDAAYNRGFQVGSQKGDMVIHRPNGTPLTIEGQFAAGMEALNRGDYTNAIMRFNVVLIEEPANTPNGFRNNAFWNAGLTHMKKGNQETALAIFILHNINYPQVLAEDTTLNIAQLLLDVKTGGFIGIGATKYYDKAKNMLTWWMSSFQNSKRYPEALLSLGVSYEKLKDKESAKATYQQVIDKYPQTTLAEEAKKKLKALNSWWHF